MRNIEEEKRIFRESPIAYAEIFWYPWNIVWCTHMCNWIYSQNWFHRTYADIVSFVFSDLQKIENDIFC